MFYSFLIILFLIIIHHFLIPITNAIPSGDEKMLIAFVRNDQKIQISKYSKQKYEAYLGIVYFMRMNWHCDKIAEEFEEYEWTECQKYCKYLDILYEYLFREYAGIPTVKPKFVFKKQIEIDGPIIYVVNCLVRISQFYFNLGTSNLLFEPKLLNEKRLNYEFKFENEPKMPINEMILQLAIDPANKWQINVNLEGIIRDIFDKNLEEMLKKSEKRVKYSHGRRRAQEINKDKYKIILNTKFDDSHKWFDDALISKFVKRNVINRKKFLSLLGNAIQNEEALGIAYFLRKNWQCDNIVEKHKEKCYHYRQYLNILYEYLFRLYVEGKDTDLANQLPAVKPIFLGNFGIRISLNDVIITLIGKSNYFWNKSVNRRGKYVYIGLGPIKLA